MQCHTYLHAHVYRHIQHAYTHCKHLDDESGMMMENAQGECRMSSSPLVRMCYRNGGVLSWGGRNLYLVMVLPQSTMDTW